jgi:predicted transcriptional regulator
MGAMSIRFPDEVQKQLRATAEAQHRSMNDIVVDAVAALIERESKRERTRAAFARIQERDAEALEMLSR